MLTDANHTPMQKITPFGLDSTEVVCAVCGKRVNSTQAWLTEGAPACFDCVGLGIKKKQEEEKEKIKSEVEVVEDYSSEEKHHTIKRRLLIDLEED